MGEVYESAATGLQIYRECYEPEGEVIGTVVAFHGLGDHLASHGLPISLMTEAGYLVCGVDWPGNGQSEGKPGHFPGGVEAAISLIGETIDFVKERVPEAKNGHPLGLYAHSTGAFYALCYFDALRARDEVSPLDWVWLSSPLLRPDHGQPLWKRRLASWIAARFPTLTFDTGVREGDCYRRGETNSKSEINHYDLCHHRVSAELGADLMRRGVEIERYAMALADPVRVFITQGTEDEVCPPEFAEEVFQKITASDKTLSLIEGKRHEPYHSLDTGPYERVARGWLAKLALCLTALLFTGCAAHRELKRDIESVVDVTKAIVDVATLEPGEVRRASYYEDLPKAIRKGDAEVVSISIDRRKVVLRDGPLDFGNARATADLITWKEESGLYRLEGNPHLVGRRVDLRSRTGVMILDRKGRPVNSP